MDGSDSLRPQGSLRPQKGLSSDSESLRPQRAVAASGAGSGASGSAQSQSQSQSQSSGSSNAVVNGSSAGTSSSSGGSNGVEDASARPKPKFQLKELKVAVPDGDGDGESDSEDDELTQEEIALKRDLRAKGPHHLHYKWVLWYNPKQAAVNGVWKSNTSQVGTFDTIEDFWRLFNNLKSPHELVPGSDYHLFKQGIKPEWEDPANKSGGKWLMNFPSKKGKEQAEAAWYDTILALVGHTFPPSCVDEVTGVVVSPRGKITRVAVWTRNAKAEYLAREVGQHLHSLVHHLLDQGGAEPLSYQEHGVPNKVIYTVE